MYTGPVLFPAGLDPASTKTAMFVLGPSGALITVPPLAEGQPGYPPSLTARNITTLAAGTPATFALTQTAAGGPGTPSIYAVDVGIPAGVQGPAYQTEIINASDLSGTPAAGYTLVYVPAQGSVAAQMAYAAMPYGSVYNAVSITPTGTTAGENRTLSSLSIPAQPFLWVPKVEAQATITGTINTKVNLIARMNNGGSGAFSGTEVAIGQGQLGPGPATVSTQMAFTSLVTGDSGSPVIPANTAVTIYLNAEQQASTADTYTTADTTYSLVVQPLGIIQTAGVALDNVGPGVFVNSDTVSMTYTAGAGDNYAIVAMAGASSSSWLTLSLAATYGGTPMTLISAADSAGGGSFTALFGIQNPAPGAQTVAISGTSGLTSIVANCASFKGWSQTSNSYPTGSSSTSISTDAVALNLDQVAVAAFVSYGSSAITVSSGSVLYSKTFGSLNFAMVSANGTGGSLQLTGSTGSSQPWSTSMVTLI